MKNRNKTHLRTCIDIITLFVLAISRSSFADNIAIGSNVIPAPLIKMDNYFSHHVVIAEKSTHQLYLFKNNEGLPELIKIYPMVTGKKLGDKLFQGDFRTPEGVYYFTEFLNHQDLINLHGKQGEIYGVGAFVLDYPNPIDQLNKKTGNGIWLHSTNDETRIEKGLDSRGCVVTANRQLIDVAKYLELHRTPIIVVHDLLYLNEKTYQVYRDNIENTVQNWLNSWQNEDIKQYIEHYHQDFRDPNRGNFSQYKKYKRAVFQGPGKPKIAISNLTILGHNDYTVVTFKQNYESKRINDVGKKTLYLKKDDYYRWKIVAERWSKKGISDNEEQLAFRPSMRFFKDKNLGTILSKIDEESKKGQN